MNTLLQKVYNALDMVIFVREADGRFRAYSQIPDWMVYFLGGAVAQRVYPLVNVFPYLSCFIDDAERHWQDGMPTPLNSGPWIEVDELEEEIALDATAISIDGEAVLIIQNLGERYIREVDQWQQVRSGLLSREILESEIQKRTLDIRRREEEIAIKLVSLTGFRDEETGAHVRRIGLYAAAMAKALNWNAMDVDNIRVAAPMHDIGKIGIPDRILRKAGALTEDEFAVMKRHTRIGAAMLRGTNIPLLDMAADIALHHHERWDGTGYPKGLVGEAIPPAARITTIVDIYDALVHERVYKKAIPEDEALKLMRDMSGRHLDPQLLELFLTLLPVMRRIRLEVREGAQTEMVD